MSRHDLALIYAVRRKSDGLTKIGWTRSLQDRLTTLRSSYGPCEIVFCEPVSAEQAEAIEEAAHQLAHKHWVENEWFNFPPPILGMAFIRRAAYEVSTGGTVDCSKIRELKSAAKLQKCRKTKAANTAKTPA